MSKKTKVSGLVIASVIAGTTIINPLASAEHITPKHTAEGTITYKEEFDTLDTKKWDVFNRGEDNYYKAYKGFNTKVENGNLVLKTRRHCVSSGEAPTESNISERPCEVGKTPRYTSGRVVNKSSLDGNKSYRLDIRAKLEWNGKKGTQPALWILRNDTSYCQEKPYDNLGEMDLFEAWPDHTRLNEPLDKNPNKRTHSGVFLSCRQGENDAGEKKSLNKTVQAQTYQEDVFNKWHTWTLIYDKENKTFEYLFDEKPVEIYNYWDTYNTSKPDKNRAGTGSKIDVTKDYGLSEEQLNKILNHTYMIILNDAVHPDQIAKREDFPEQRFLIDSVVVRQYDKSPYEKDKPEENPSVTPTDKPKESPSATPTDKPEENPSATPTDKPEENPSVTPTSKPSDSSSESPTNTPEDENNVDNPTSIQTSVSETVQTPVQTPVNTSEPSTPEDSQNPSTSINIPSDNDNTEDVDDRKVYDPIVREKKESTEKTSSNEPFVKKDQSQTPVQNKVVSPSIQSQQLSPAPVVAPPAPVQPVYAPKVGPTVDTGGSVHVSWWKNFYNKLVG